jgi:S1-C subfamily serine protease
MTKFSMGSAASAVALALVGFAAGSVIAGTTPIEFKKTTLYDAMRRIHRDTGVDVLWTGDAKDARSFSVVAGEPGKMVSATASEFGRVAVPVVGITVLDPALPDAASGLDREHALAAWLTETLPTAKSGSGQGDYFAPFNDAMLSNVQGLRAQLPAGTTSFSQLTPQQQVALDALRATQLNGLLGALPNVAR